MNRLCTNRLILYVFPDKSSRTLYFCKQILDIPAIVLANLCNAYIMTSQNEIAEDLMRRVEKAEERKNMESPQEKTLHLCIINMVIGTLYCSKGNYEFGISRIIKSLEPADKKVCQMRCLLDHSL